MHPLGHMTVHVQREARRGVAQVGLHGLHVVAVFDRDDGVTVPIGYNREQSEKPCNFNGLTTPKYSFSHDI